jgi:hypothetical protein
VRRQAEPHGGAGDGYQGHGAAEGRWDWQQQGEKRGEDCGDDGWTTAVM